MILASSNVHNSALAEAVDLASVRIDPAWALRVPAEFARRKQLIPLCRIDQQVVVATTASELDARTEQLLRKYLHCDFRLIQCSEESLRDAVARVHSQTTFEQVSLDTNAVNASATANERPHANGDESHNAIAACDELLQAAVLRGASDIHLVPTEQSMIVQLRVDGELELFRQLPLALHGPITSRLKVLAGLDIAEKRAPQDGRISIRPSSKRARFDIRVATLPTRHGERMTLRLLAPPAECWSLANLGMRNESLQLFEQAAARPHGLILLTGPTGSGKSTTLYVAIEQLMRQRGGNVITIEDPIEYEIAGASQVEVDTADKVNFSKALRSLLRHDPDVVMIGEIRDAETANIAVKASLTGHLVFSTLHTNTAAGVITRLIDLGIEPFLIAATLRMSVAQRLVRGLCPHCRRPREMSSQEAQMLGHSELAGATVFDPHGCVYCAGRGYRGRIGLFEMLPGSEELARTIAVGAGEPQILEFMQQSQLKLLIDDGLSKVLNGTTTASEVISAVQVW